MNNFVYHRVPDSMLGSVLYPLNELKSILPDVYEEQVKKYEHRKYLLTATIPILNCLWNDVLHLSPVNPTQIKTAYQELGQSIELKSFQIDATRLEKEKTIFYLHKYPEADRLKPDNWGQFSTEKLAEYTELPKKTIEYYKTQFEAGLRPLIYVWVPHILYLGSIDVIDSAIVS